MGWGPGCAMWGPGYWSGGPFGMVIMLLFWALVIVGAVYLVRVLTRRADPGAPAMRDTPLEILKRRYAGGEIIAEEFTRIRGELR